MNFIEYIGFIAGLFVAISLLPQVIKSWKTKSTRDLAMLWNVINLIGQILWIVYGYGINSYPLIAMSAITLVMLLSLIILKLKYG
ncbi:MAG: SemiSWEET family transporter [Patescibacteria group bacterium]